MSKVSIQDIDKLKKMTGAGMMDCRSALIEAEGDFDKAIEILRSKGKKIASQRADHEAKEGLIIANTNNENSYGVIFLLSCETDFVSRNDEFINAAESIMQTAIKNQIKSKDELLKAQILNLTVESVINELLSKFQEKIEISKYEYCEAPFVAAYNHHNRKVGAIVAFNKGDTILEEVGKNIAMQVAAMNPIAIRETEVSQEIIEKELEFARYQARKEGKPENIVNAIAQGKLTKFFAENVLLNQQYIKDNTLSVNSYLQSIDKDLSIIKFIRISL